MLRRGEVTSQLVRMQNRASCMECIFCIAQASSTDCNLRLSVQGCCTGLDLAPPGPEEALWRSRCGAARASFFMIPVRTPLLGAA